MTNHIHILCTPSTDNGISKIKKKTKSKGSLPTQGSALKMVYLATSQIQEKWQRPRVRNWSEIYPQLCIFFEEVMAKYER